jgi:hypothetical protein
MGLKWGAIGNTLGEHIEDLGNLKGTWREQRKNETVTSGIMDWLDVLIGPGGLLLLNFLLLQPQFQFYGWGWGKRKRKRKTKLGCE